MVPGFSPQQAYGISYSLLRRSPAAIYIEPLLESLVLAFKATGTQIQKVFAFHRSLTVLCRIPGDDSRRRGFAFSNLGGVHEIL